MTWETGICKKKKAGGTSPARKHQIVDGVIVHYCQHTILRCKKTNKKVGGLFPTYAEACPAFLGGIFDKVLWHLGSVCKLSPMSYIRADN